MDIFITDYDQSGYDQSGYDQSMPMQLGFKASEMSIGELPLEFAVLRGNITAVQTLIDRIPRPRQDDFHASTIDDQGTYAISKSQPLRIAINGWHRSPAIVRILIDAGHFVCLENLKDVIIVNDSEILEILLEGVKKQEPIRPVPAYSDRAFLWAQVRKEMKTNQKKNIRTVELLAKAGVNIQERTLVDSDFLGNNTTYPVAYLLQQGCPGQQVLQSLNDFYEMRRFVIDCCSIYNAGVVRSKLDWLAGVAFIKGFHPRFTALLCSDEVPEGSDDSYKLQKGCEFLLSQVLDSFMPLYQSTHKNKWYRPLEELVKYLLENGCKISIDMVMKEITRWQSLNHVLFPEHECASFRKTLYPGGEVKEELGNQPGFPMPPGRRSARCIAAQIDAYLSLVSPETLNETKELNFEEGGIKPMTPLSLALLNRQWLVAYRLIHHGARLPSLLDEPIKQAITSLYWDTFPNGVSHPLVAEAAAGRYTPDQEMFSEVIGGNRFDLALTLVMLTIGLPDSI
ncbi:hypothetical protein E8E14_008295 [Neopestalotiopsis sp. 37M]|nr:hypothetical protein E8E14_008295 [Neopestalotiopsis sp. 37M]